MLDKTRENQYQYIVDLRDRYGLGRLGLMSSVTWALDPKHVFLVMARYKFVAKMLAGRANVLEIGCGDSFYTRIVQQAVRKVTAVDFDAVLIAAAKENLDERWPMDLRVHDMLQGPVEGKFDGAYSLDVVEHIARSDEDRFLANLCASLTDQAIAVIGMPSLESQAYASPQSKAGHVNCKTGDALAALLKGYFENVFLFSMNDEVVHTGFNKMAHYLMALCVSPHRTDTNV